MSDLQTRAERDRLVFDLALRNNIPVAVTLAGGYARTTAHTVAIHCNTVKQASAALEPGA